MAKPGKSIQTRLLVAVLLTSFIVLLLTCAAVIAYEFITYRKEMVTQLYTRSHVLAASSTASLAFQNQSDAVEILSSLGADGDMSASAIYDAAGRLFAKFPANLPDSQLPVAPDSDGHRFSNGHILIFTPIVQNDKRLGTLYIQYNLDAVNERFRLYAVVTALVMVASFLVIWLVCSKTLRRISKPILSLAESVRSISETEDYSVRAEKFSDDELGQLTDGFNTMVTRVQARDAALRHSEQLLRELADAMPQIIWTARPDGSLDYFNQRWFDYSASTFEQSQGAGWTARLYPDDLKPCMDAWMESISTGNSFHLEARLQRAVDGAFRWHLVRALPSRGPDNRIVRWVGSWTDINDQKSAAAEIQTLNNELEKRVLERTNQLTAVNKELEAFCYSVSHDLRAPLRHINGYAQLLSSKAAESLNEKGRHYLSSITQSADKMGQLIDDLLVFSRMGRSELRMTQIDLEHLVNDTIRSLAPDTQNRKINWSIGKLPPVKADLAMMRQVFANLLGNAVKYTRQRELASIEVLCRNENSEDTVICVRDNGAGFDMKYVDKLFGVFQRLHSDEDFEGTGIGLANVNRIITRHGGRCWAEGKIDAGATFSFSLPKPQ